jgi:hypothetical protein
MRKYSNFVQLLSSGTVQRYVPEDGTIVTTAEGTSNPT